MNHFETVWTVVSTKVPASVFRWSILLIKSKKAKSWGCGISSATWRRRGEGAVENVGKIRKAQIYTGAVWMSIDVMEQCPGAASWRSWLWSNSAGGRGRYILSTRNRIYTLRSWQQLLPCYLLLNWQAAKTSDNMKVTLDDYAQIEQFICIYYWI